MARTGSGVEIRASSIRIKFVLNGETVRERLAVPPTPANIKYATRLAADIRRAIAQGTFTFAEFFPESVRGDTNTFGYVAGQWLDSKGQLEDATRDQYRNAVAFWKGLLGADEPMRALTYKVLSAKIGKHPWASAKSANNYLIALRGIFAFEYSGARAAENPTIGIKNFKVVKKLPDPLTVDERDAILEEMQVRRDPRVWAYFTFAFFTGMRPEEIIALQWGDIDFAHKIARVQRVRTFRGSEREGSKTHTVRDVDLVQRAMTALAVMKPYTYLKSADVFENPVTGAPWHDERSQRDHYWTPTLKRLGIRHRRAYNTRHTYATAALMAGVKPPYIAAQLGHTNTKMLFEKYARWITLADEGRERKALEIAFSQQPEKRAATGG